MATKSIRNMIGVAYAVLSIWAADTKGTAQNPSAPKVEAPYEMHLSVDEVSILFHATDAHGLAISDLKAEELDLLDEEKGPGRILALQPLSDRPLSVGFLIDVSGSVARYVGQSRTWAAQVAQTLISRPGDTGLVVTFGRSRRVVQPWSDQQKSVMAAIGQVAPGPNRPTEGTGIFDALFATCHYEFGGSKRDGRQHVLLLFSDGEDTASHMSQKDAVEECNQAHTAVYAIAPWPVPGTSSTGPITLRDLTERTGGRILREEEPDAEKKADIVRLSNDLRQEYELFYRPKDLKHDGAFHRIVLVGLKRVASIDAQSGYYAPAR